VDVYPSIAALIEEGFARHADREAAVCLGTSLRFSQIAEMSEALAAWLQSRGLAPGARVALMMPNLPQYMVAIAAVLRAGYVVVNVNPLYTPRELEHQLKDSGADAIFILENFATTLQQVADKVPTRLIVVASMGDLLGFAKGLLVNFVVRNVKKMVPEYRLTHAYKFLDALADGLKLNLKPVQVSHDDVAFLQYTGGTTGVSKGATLTHRNIIANMLQSEAWYQPALKKLKPGEYPTTITALPLYHIFALTVCAMMSMRIGGHCVLIPNPRDIPGFVKELSKHRFHVFPAVNTLFNALLNDDEFRRLDFSRLILSAGGGMAVQEAVAKRWLEATGCPIAEGYGLSETSPVATANSSDTEKFTGTIGLPVSSTEIAILDDEGKHLPVGATGEIAIRGPQVMAGYWNRPDETAKVMTPDGFFRTGDIGIMDSEGFTKIVDRKKDMILVSGFNVYPNEVEGVVAAHPGVLECAAVGVPDEYAGEAVKLFVVKKDPALTERDIMDFCKEQLTGYKKPKYIEFRTDLPKTNVGKILRRELRDKKA
jgi:long-chain acyl-CoA synthetase